MTWGHHRPRMIAVTAAAALLVPLAAACSTTEPVALPSRTSSSSPSATTSATTSPAPSLDAYYGQKISWEKCGPNFRCGELTVPIDYAAPSGGDIKLSVLKVPARNQGKRIGSLVVNPGGPGGSGVDYASNADLIVGPSVRQFYDVVGFDPRGVARSAPIDCLDDAQLDTFLSADPTPDDRAEETALQKQGRLMATGCKDKNPALVGHVSTQDAAKDMDVLRAALGDDYLTYLGKSYGTFLGSTYADLFPERVGRFVLDGVVPPDLTSEEMNLGQAQGFELATRAYLQDCVDAGNCPMGSSVDAGIAGFRKFLAQVDATPLPSGDSAVPKLNEAWATLGIVVAMYDQGSWGILTDAMVAAQRGDGSQLMALANRYADRDPGGGYTDNLMEVIWAVNCLDRPDSPDLSTFAANAKTFATSAPLWGPTLAWGSVACGVWDVKGGRGPHEVHAPGSNPIVVVGTTRDPATIYEWSVRLREQLDNASLLTLDGDGHTAYRRGSSCIDDAIDAYYVQGTVPEDGKKC